MEPSHLSLAVLAQEAYRESRSLLHSRLTENRYAWELFRRAIVEQDEQAWQYILTLYNHLVISWIHQCAPALLLSREDAQSLANETFARFARSCGAQKFTSIASLPALMAYLKLCVRSTVLDELRRQQVRNMYELKIDEVVAEPRIEDPAEGVVERLDAEGLWHLLASLTRRDECIILHCVYVQGLTPRDIQQRYADLFPSIEDVYRVKRNVLDRLKRSAQLKAFLGEHV